MRWAHYKQVAIKSLRVDAADIRRRMKQAHVIDLAADIRAAGDEPIHAPTIRESDKRLLCGRDRLAASLINDATRIWVHVADCDDIEAQQLERRENIYRRPVENRAEQLAQLVALTEQHLRAVTIGDSVPQSERGVTAEAHRQVARAAGIKPASVKKAVARAAQQDSAADGRPLSARSDSEPAASAAEPALPPHIDLLGVDDVCARYVADQAAADQAAIDRADQLLRQAQGELRKLTDCTAHQNLHQQVHRVASLVRSARPATICPWCKGLPQEVYGQRCLPCAGMGYVPQEVRDRAPVELVWGPPVVAIDGKFVSYADVRDGKVKPGANGKPGKRLSVVDENDQPLEG